MMGGARLVDGTRTFAPDWVEAHRIVEEKDRHFATVQLEEERRYEEHSKDAAWLLHAIRVEQNACRHLDERTQTRLREIEDEADAGAAKVRQERHVVETRLEHLAEQHVSEGYGLLADERRSQAEAEKYTREIGDEVCHLYGDVERARQFRVEKGEKLAGAVKARLDEIKDAISAESRIRKESEATLLELFGQMGTKMQKELDDTRQERAKTSERLISVMEQVVPHIERTRLFKTREIH